MKSIQDIRHKLEQLKGKKAQIESDISNIESKLSNLRRDKTRHLKALTIVQEVGLATQKRLEFKISDSVTAALESVFLDPYEFVTEFVERNNKTECDLYFKKGERKMDPLFGSGVGTADVASFALRPISYAIHFPRLRNTFILDEPFKHLRGEYEQEMAGQMIKELGSEFDIQMIIVSDVLFTINADKTFKIKIKNGRSIINDR